MSKLSVSIVITSGCLGLLSSPALALTGDEILAKVDRAINAPKDMKAEIKMTIKNRDGNTEERKMKIFWKGSQKKLFTFLAPAYLKGVGFLVIDDDTLYLYSPAFGKARRILSQVKNENFMGTDFSYNDLSESKLSKKYSAVLDRSNCEAYVLTCTSRPGADTDYSRMAMFVNRKSFIPFRVEIYNKAGKLFKIMDNTDVEKIDGYWTPKRVAMKDVQASHITVLELVTVKYDQNLPAKTFSKRNLMKVH